MEPAADERTVRVSTLELFFDLVFVFTVTQLTGVLARGGDVGAAAQAAVMLALVWWMYDGYAWLTNAISTDRVRFRLLLLGGMGCFLVIALAIQADSAAAMATVTMAPNAIQRLIWRIVASMSWSRYASLIAPTTFSCQTIGMAT